MNLTEEELQRKILIDPLMYAAYQLGKRRGYEQGYEHGQDDTEEYWRRQGNI